jgi:hypothetical protein
VTDRPLPRGELASEKSDAAAEPDRPQPQAAEVESARQLENAAAARLQARGVPRDEVGRLADEYIALDLGEDADEFVAWAERRLGL